MTAQLTGPDGPASADLPGEPGPSEPDRRRPVAARPRRSRAEGRPRRSRRRWPWILALVLLVALAAGGVYLVRYSTVLGLKNVAVSGIDTDDSGLAERVRGAVDVSTGTPLITLDVNGIAASVREIPVVAAVKISRRWPGTLLIAVTRREPLAYTRANGGTYLLDKLGTPYLAVPTAPENLLVVELATPAAGDPSTMAALSVVQALTPELTGMVAAVRAPSPYNVSLQLRDNRRVVWGDAADGDRKAQILPAVLQQPGAVFDVSDPSMVTVR